jgi:hypothetical protein
VHSIVHRLVLNLKVNQWLPISLVLPKIHTDAREDPNQWLLQFRKDCILGVHFSDANKKLADRQCTFSNFKVFEVEVDVRQVQGYEHASAVHSSQRPKPEITTVS